jgi:hypothetical protein
MGGGGEPGEPSNHSPDTIGITTLEDLGAGAILPGVALLGMPAPVPHTTKSYSELPTLSPRWGPASTTSTTVAPCSVPPAPNTSIADATTRRR